MPPLDAHAPNAITHFGSGICSYMRLRMGAIFFVRVPATIMRSAWRGEGLITSAPNRERSKVAEAGTMRPSMAQHARPNDTGHRAFFRAQLTKKSTVVMRTF